MGERQHWCFWWWSQPGDSFRGVCRVNICSWCINAASKEWLIMSRRCLQGSQRPFPHLVPHDERTVSKSHCTKRCRRFLLDHLHDAGSQRGNGEIWTKSWLQWRRECEACELLEKKKYRGDPSSCYVWHCEFECDACCCIIVSCVKQTVVQFGGQDNVFGVHPQKDGANSRPCIEAVQDEEAYLTEHPLDIIGAGRAHRIPLMMGVLAQDGLLTSSGEDYSWSTWS